MGFKLGGFDTTGTNCGCCAPPCNWSLCVRGSCCLGYIGLELGERSSPADGTIRFEGPGGADYSFAVAPSHGQLNYCLADPEPGWWTVTASYPGRNTETTTVLVEQCGSQTVTFTKMYLLSTEVYYRLRGSCCDDDRDVELIDPNGVSYGSQNTGPAGSNVLEWTVEPPDGFDPCAYPQPGWILRISGGPDAGCDGYDLTEWQPAGGCGSRGIIGPPNPDFCRGNMSYGVVPAPDPGWGYEYGTTDTPERHMDPAYFCSDCAHPPEYVADAVEFDGHSYPRVLHYSDSLGACDLTLGFTPADCSYRDGLWKGVYTFPCSKVYLCDGSTCDAYGGIPAQAGDAKAFVTAKTFLTTDGFGNPVVKWYVSVEIFGYWSTLHYPANPAGFCNWDASNFYPFDASLDATNCSDYNNASVKAVLKFETFHFASNTQFGPILDCDAAPNLFATGTYEGAYTTGGTRFALGAFGGSIVAPACLSGGPDPWTITGS